MEKNKEPRRRKYWTARRVEDEKAAIIADKIRDQEDEKWRVLPDEKTRRRQE